MVTHDGPATPSLRRRVSDPRLTTKPPREKRSPKGAKMILGRSVSRHIFGAVDGVCRSSRLVTVRYPKRCPRAAARHPKEGAVRVGRGWIGPSGSPSGLGGLGALGDLVVKSGRRAWR